MVSLSLLSFSFFNFPDAVSFSFLKVLPTFLALSSFWFVTVDGYGLWVLHKVSEKLKVLPRQTSFKIYNKPTPYLLKHPI